MNKEAHQRWASLTVAGISFFSGWYLRHLSGENSHSTWVDSRPAEYGAPASTGVKNHAQTTGTGRTTWSSASPPMSETALNEIMPDPPGSDVFARFGITVGDVRKTEELNKNSWRGEFVLKNERPMTKKALAYALNRSVSSASEARRVTYTEEFHRLGVSSESSDQALNHLAKIHLASLEAKLAIQQVLDARQRYDGRMQALLGPEKYREYREFESTSPAKAELERIKASATTMGLELDSSFEAPLMNVLREARAFTSTTWHGPYDGLPEVALGIENVIERVSTRQQDLASSLVKAIDLCEEQGIPETVRTIVHQHFVTALAGMERSKTEILNPAQSNPKP